MVVDFGRNQGRIGKGKGDIGIPGRKELGSHGSDTGRITHIEEGERRTSELGMGGKSCRHAENQKKYYS